jgi:hypothetical protein
MLLGQPLLVGYLGWSACTPSKQSKHCQYWPPPNRASAQKHSGLGWVFGSRVHVGAAVGSGVGVSVGVTLEQEVKTVVAQ